MIVDVEALCGLGKSGALSPSFFYVGGLFEANVLINDEHTVLGCMHGYFNEVCAAQERVRVSSSCVLRVVARAALIADDEGHFFVVEVVCLRDESECLEGQEQCEQLHVGCSYEEIIY